MKNQFPLSSIALLVSAIALSGCAPKKAWSPELEEAREAYQRASSNPVVNSLAAAELDAANKNLQAAEDAAAFFKGREVIAHEASLAHLKSLEAEQTARALEAKTNLRTAQAALPRQPLLDTQPILVARTSTPAATSAKAKETAKAQARKIGARSSNGRSNEMQQIAEQLAKLSEQLANIEANSESNNSSVKTAPAAKPEKRMDKADADNEPDVAAAAPAPKPTNNNDAYARALSEAAPSVAYNGRLREELRALNARPSSNGMALTLGERYFESGTAKLWKGRAGRHLDNIAAVLVENPGLVIDVEAHTDNQGTKAEKDKITSDRATAIKSGLVLRGVNGSRINTTGFGDTAPVADNDTQLGKLQNRRVEIVFANIEGF